MSYSIIVISRSV